MSKYTKYILILCLTTTIAIVSCEQSSINSPSTDDQVSSMDYDREALLNEISVSLEGINSLEDINAKLAANGLNIEIAYAETVTPGATGADAMGQTIFANDREKRLEAQWVAGDPRRNADGDNITQVTDQTFSFANIFNPQIPIDGEPAIDASFDTWNNVKGAKLDVVKLPDTGSTNYSAILGTGESIDPIYADVSTIGFLPGSIFDDVLGEGASSSVLGVTFTLIWLDGPDGEPTDINNDGYEDLALKEVWYNDAFGWSTDGTLTDIETVALHENGHALGFGHFGKISVTDNNNKLHVSPRAVMNAIVLGTQRDLLGTDKASYKSIYGNWPK